YAPTLGDGPAALCLPLWALLGDLYIGTQDWHALARMGQDIRSLPRGAASMSGFGWFVEGRALVGLGDREAAKTAFDEAVRAGIPGPSMTLEVANQMLDLGFPRQAAALLVPKEEELGDQLRYWELVFRATYALREDEALLFKAARRALDLAPANPIWRMNYAVALLINRQRPAEAARFTLEFLHEHPDSSVARLNHAHALAMLGRTAEARQFLESVPAPADPESRTALATVQLEIALAENLLDDARAILPNIDEQFLFPGQQRWLADARRRVESGGKH
ncbi:MAG: hypothetical protein D6766_09860, partial [Verrucomicrobia bacterium]